MNYLKLFESASALFPKKIKVTLVHATTGQHLLVQKIGLEQLPDVFNKPTVLDLDGQPWRILKADPLSADDFAFTKKLRLHVQEWTGSLEEGAGFMEPTLAGEWPATGTSTLFDDFTLLMTPAQWRQVEFLPASMLPVIEAEMAEIAAILQPADGSDPLQGYGQVYQRRQTAPLALQVPLEDFCKLVNCHEKGHLQWNDEGMVANGFAVRSSDHLYYGTVQNNLVQHLALQQFIYMDEELMELLTQYNLVLVDWCNGSIMGSEFDN